MDGDPIDPIAALDQMLRTVAFQAEIQRNAANEQSGSA
jgi:hypothetical protein